MKLECKRCVKEMSAFQMDDQVNGHPVKKMMCSSCYSCSAVCIDDRWEDVDSIFYDHGPDGFRDGCGERDALVHYILSRVMRSSEPRTHPHDCLFDVPDPDDRLRLLVRSSEIVAFYTVKPKGTRIEVTGDSYRFHTLDTVYVRPGYRGRGLASSVLSDLLHLYPDQQIGVSSPVSPSMIRVFDKFWRERPEHRFTFWQVDGGGGPASRKVLFLELSRTRRQE